MKKLNVSKFFRVAVILLIAAMTSCGDDSDLSRIVTDYLKETMSFNFEEAKKYVAKEKIMLYEEAQKKYSTYDTGLYTAIIKNSEIQFTVVNKYISDNGNTAKVTVQISLIDCTFKDREILLIKENGEWKVANDNIDNILPPNMISFKKGKGVYIDETQEPITDSIEDENEEPIFNIVESMPQFPGGEQAMMEFIKKNIIYPADAKDKGISGRVFVQFVVEKDGSISEIKVLRGIEELNDEAIRIIKTMPKWNPGKQRDNAVRVRHNGVPIIFRLDE